MARHDHERKRSRSRSPGHRNNGGSSRTERDRHKDRNGKKHLSERRTHSSRHRSRSHSSSPSRSSHYRSSHRSPSSPSGGHRRHRDRSRSRSPSRHSRSSDGAINRERVEDIIGGLSYQNFDIDEQQQRLERIMQERRERVEKWRSQHKIVDDPAAKVEAAPKEVEQTKEEAEHKKTWTLDDENDDDEEDGETDPQNEANAQDDEEDNQMLHIPQREKTKEDEEDEDDKIAKVVKSEHSGKEEEPASEPMDAKDGKHDHQAQDDNQTKQEDESKMQIEEEAKKVDDEDPLDAFMKGIQEEVKKYRSTTVKANKDKVTVMVGVAKKKAEDKKRGELMEQNQDAMEYSSSDEIDKDDDLMGANGLENGKVKQKKLMTISKDDITYLPFRKAFYIEVPEIRQMTNEQVEAYKLEIEGVKTKGKGCPRPIKTWAHCGVSKKVLDVLKKNNYEKPTPIQCQAIPAIMSGRDLIGIAKTGSGKTLAFLLPMFRHILDQPPLEPGEGAIAIIMIPTRELATQIYAECRKFAKPLGLRVVAVYGGTPISEQIGDLKPGAEIVVCTPGRMIDMLAANSGRVTNLRRCTYVVLDEADRMFDMGFEPQVMRIIDTIRPDRQTVMFSATFPRIMEALARRILDKPIEVQVGGRSVVCKEVEQSVILIKEDDKFLKLLEVLGKYSTQGSAIIFVDKQEHADMLLKELMHASYTCLALHGGIDQNDRDSTIADFKNGKVQCLVATSVAARGLDVKHCIVVVNYDCPNHYEDYVHRCGRTGRAGNKGYAYTFITPDQGRYVADIIKALESSGNSVPQELYKLFEQFKKEQEFLGKKVKSSSGFTGKGFKFDEAEAMQAAEKKKFQKAALGLQDSDDEEEEEEEDIDKAIESMLASKKRVTVAGVPLVVSTGANSVGAIGTTTTATTTLDVTGKSVTEKLEIARQRASILSMAKGGNMAGPSSVSNLGLTPLVSTTAQAEAILKGDGFSYSLGSIASAVNAKSLAEQRAEALHAKLNYIPKDFEYNENGEIIRREDEIAALAAAAAAAGSGANTRYEEELEINDAPQQARWRVTSKEAIAAISEFSEAGITVRGTHFPPGKEPGPGERKLYLAIEGMTEMAVAKAKSEIYRLIKEEMAKVKLSNNYLPGTTKGRYKVL